MPAMVGDTALHPGRQFGRRYRIISFLGSGGMGAVYQAWDETLGTAVALKLIRVDAGTPTFERQQLEDRFKRELKLARQVTHANVIRIHDLGEVEGTLYFTMEYVQGSDLAILLAREHDRAREAAHVRLLLRDHAQLRQGDRDVPGARGDYPDATSELQKCRNRRGEATAVFLDDLPSFRYYATLPYWLGRAREMQKLDARPQYQEFLRIRQAATDDPLVDDARKRLGATSG